MEAEALVALAREQCLNLESSLRKQMVQLAGLESAASQLSGDFAAQSQHLQRAFQRLGAEAERWRSQTAERSAEVGSQMTDMGQQAEAWRATLDEQLAEHPQALQALQQAAAERLPQLRTEVEQLQQAVEQLSEQVEGELEQLCAELERSQDELLELHSRAEEQRQQLAAQLQQGLESGAELESLAQQAMGQVEGALENLKQSLQAGLSAGQEQLQRHFHGTGQELQQQLREQPLSELEQHTRQLAEALEQLRQASQAHGRQTCEGTLGLQRSLTRVCEAMEPLLAVHGQAQRMGAF